METLKDLTDGALNAELTPEEEAVYKQFLLQASQNQSGPQQKPNYLTVIPTPGFCLKTKAENGDKVFINICTADNVPAPKEIAEDELIRLLDSEDPSGFRVPMSIGEPHAEIDKSGKGCTAYDIVIHPTFLVKVKTSSIFQGFLITVSLEGIEHKYSVSLSRDWVILKNRRFIGSLPEQYIRSESKPWIMEMEGDSPVAPKPLISEVNSQYSEDKRSKAPEPKYTIVQEPPEGQAEFLVAEIELPNVKTAKSLTLDLGEDRIVLKTRSDIYSLDIFLPYNIIQDECGAQFNRQTKILTITMPVLAET